MTPETKSKYRRLIQRIKVDPYYGRAEKPCGKCGGSGRHKGQIDSCRRCIDCNGYGLQFREDDEGREVIAEAVREWLLNDPNWQWYYRQPHGWVMSKASRGLRYEHRVVSENDQQHPPDLWEIRHGQPWEQSLTDYVRNYRRDPPNLLTLEGCEELKRILLDAGYDIDIYHYVHSGVSVEIAWHQEAIAEGEADTEPAALLAACEAAFL